LYFHVPWEFTIAGIRVNDTLCDFNKYSDLVTVKLAQPFHENEIAKIRIQYEGTFHPFNKKHEIFNENFITTNRWHPWIWMNYYETFDFEATVWLPEPFQAVSKGWIAKNGNHHAYQIKINRCAQSHTALYAGAYRRYEDNSGPIPIHVFTFSHDETCARQILDRCKQTLAYYESVYASFPYAYLCVVEDPYQSSGGMATPTMIKMQSIQWQPENRNRFMDMYLPHEIAHQWWGKPYPNWICEGMAVMSNVAFLNQVQDKQGKEILIDELDRWFQKAQIMAANTPLKTDRNPYSYYTRAFYLFHTLYQGMGMKSFFSMMSAYNQHIAQNSHCDQEKAATILLDNIQKKG
ncbi:hypothetical protein GF373_10900, partial [bacterium]|nr:hypothetical protein [bacterium]